MPYLWSLAKRLGVRQTRASSSPEFNYLPYDVPSAVFRFNISQLAWSDPARLKGSSLINVGTGSMKSQDYFRFDERQPTNVDLTPQLTPRDPSSNDLRLSKRLHGMKYFSRWSLTVEVRLACGPFRPFYAEWEPSRFIYTSPINLFLSKANDSSQYCPTQVGPVQISPLEIGLAQVSLGKIGSG